MTKTLTSCKQQTGQGGAVITLKHKASEGNNTQTTTKRLQNTLQRGTERVKGLVVGQKWRVGADSLNIILYQRQINKKTGKEYWRAHSYYATVANALVELVNQGVRDSELADLKTVCGKIDQLRKDILKACAASYGERLCRPPR